MLEMLPIGKLLQHKDNPRKDLGDLVELTQSIKQSGVMQNLTVVKNYDPVTGEFSGNYTVIIGHRRLAAARIAGMTMLPCVVVDMTPEEQVATMLAENMQRVDLTPYEQAQGLQLMFDFGESVESASKKTGLSVSTVRRRKKLLDFDEQILKNAVEQGATLNDLAELEEIEDVDEKNKVLEHFGESDFRWNLNAALRKQNEAKAMAEWTVFLEDSEAMTIDIDDEIYGELILFGSVYCCNTVPSIQEYKERPLYYRTTGSMIYFYRERCEADDVKEEIDKEKVREQEEREQKFAKLKELTAIAADTRENFIKSVTEKQCSAILNEICVGFIMANFHGVRSYRFDPRECLKKYCGLSVYAMNSSQISTMEASSRKTYIDNMSDAVRKEPAKYLFCVLMSMLDPGKEKGYYNAYTLYPKYEGCVALDEVYRILCLLGYTMTEAEEALKDGTHELFEG